MSASVRCSFTRPTPGAYHSVCVIGTSEAPMRASASTNKRPCPSTRRQCSKRPAGTSTTSSSLASRMRSSMFFDSSCVKRSRNGIARSRMYGRVCAFHSAPTTSFEGSTVCGGPSTAGGASSHERAPLRCTPSPSIRSQYSLPSLLRRSQ
ncbi:hypothetical protein WQQ_13430 [Hydrocarboniphaga effusa AP103]|uniref:Uncharacterized protein n=1 Tax=Hydrocarboniphaga effusa AP103 TaxID=1172194 RepID=I8I4M0_9GAMM|nr:hypothetical protein WQQ_13430 [Hydrocarboniphaga effusa AP103]